MGRELRRRQHRFRGGHDPGRQHDRPLPRAPYRPGVLVGLAPATASTARIAERWMLVVVAFLLRLFDQGLIGHAAMVAMARRFVATHGRADLVAGFGLVTGEPWTLPPLRVGDCSSSRRPTRPAG